MPKTNFTVDREWNATIDAKADTGYRVLVYSGSLGGGTLSARCEIDGVSAAIPNMKLNAATLDDNGDVVKMVGFSAAGTLYVALTGSTTPNVDVAVR
jgi:hypothetical protein